MTYNLTYQIKGIEGQFVMPIRQEDTVKYVSTLIKKEFGIIPKLTARIYGSELQSTNIISQCVRNQDVVTFDVKKTDESEPKLEFYRQPIVTPRYQSRSTFIVFTTINFESMIIGNKIKVDIGTDTASKIISKIKDMFKNKYKSSINDTKLKSMNILLFLPGGIPF